MTCYLMYIDIYYMVIVVLPQTKTPVFSLFSPVHEDMKKNVTRVFSRGISSRHRV